MIAGALFLVYGQHPVPTITGAFVMSLLGVLLSVLFSATLAKQRILYRGVALTESTMMASLADRFGIRLAFGLELVLLAIALLLALSALRQTTTG